MEVKKIIKYLLIVNLASGKIIYEMSNSPNPETIYDINQIFNAYYKQHFQRAENMQVDGYYLTMTLERIFIMAKTDDSFPFEKNFEFFKKIIDEVPELSNPHLNSKNISLKIKNTIYNYFNNKNSDKQPLKTISLKKNNNQLYKMKTNSCYNEEDIIMKVRNTLINNSKNLDIDKSSFVNMIHDKDNKKDRKILIKSKKITVRTVDDSISEKNKNTGNNPLTTSKLEIKNKISDNKFQPTPAMYTNLIRELQKIIWQISCCKKIIFVILIIIIIAQIIAIPIIITKSYSY